MADIQQSLRAHAVMSIILALAALALLISGLVASGFKAPTNFTGSTSTDRADVDRINQGLKVIALGGAIPGGVSAFFAILGAIGGFRNVKGLIITHMVFAIILIIAQAIATLIPLYSAAVFQTACDALKASDACIGPCQVDYGKFCSGFVGALWAAVVLGIITIILNFAVSISACCVVCCGETKPAEQQNPVVIAVPVGVPVGMPVTQGNAV